MKNHLAKLTQAIYQVGQSDQNNEKTQARWLYGFTNII